MRRLVLLALLPMMLAACDGKDAIARYRERQAQIDPTQLWSVEVVPAQTGINPIRICADKAIRDGLARPWPSAGGEFCKPTRNPVDRPGSHVMKCEFNGEPWTAVATVTGDEARDYVASLSASPISEDGPGYTQTRRFKLLGPCPSGWNIGDRTDQQGVKHPAGAGASPS